jgi:hypothetical protein
MLVGIDFDNTIVCYDGLFHRLAAERGLIPEELPATKGHVRDHLRATGREPLWTELQGVAYGPRLAGAEPFPGVKDFLARCRRDGVRCVVVSHKTRYPYLGPKYDLHEAADAWLRKHGFYESDAIGLSPASVHLELTLPAKLGRIGALGCDCFIDDLPELLGEPAFPEGPRRVLFDPAGACPDAPHYRRVRSWGEIESLIFGQGGRA